MINLHYQALQEDEKVLPLKKIKLTVQEMLKEQDKIFKNLYNEYGWSIDDSLIRDDWSNTKEIISK